LLQVSYDRENFRAQPQGLVERGTSAQRHVGPCRPHSEAKRSPSSTKQRESPARPIRARLEPGGRFETQR